jgi:ADP-heptose:LPS heptosyltransferase
MNSVKKLLLASPLGPPLQKFHRTFRSHLDRLFFPFWLLTHCAVRRQRAVIIWRTAALGDIICTLPLCRAIRERHPESFLVFVTVRAFKDIVRLSREADAIYGVDHVYTNPSWVSSVTRYLFGLVAQIYEPLTADERSHGQRGSPSHLVDDFAASCALKVEDRQPRLFPSPEFIKHLQSTYGLTEDLATGRLLIGINGGHTWPVREWDAAKWQQIIDLIHSEFDATIIQFGLNLTPTPDEYDRLLGVRSLVNQLTMEELVGLIASCHLVVSIDSGPVHVAGAVGTPVVGLFGAVNPLYRLPPSSLSIGVTSNVPCLFCHHRTPIEHWKTGCPYDIRCMKKLEVAPVFDAIRTMLKTHKNKTSL